MEGIPLTARVSGMRELSGILRLSYVEDFTKGQIDRSGLMDLERCVCQARRGETPSSSLSAGW